MIMKSLNLFVAIVFFTNSFAQSNSTKVKIKDSLRHNLEGVIVTATRSPQDVKKSTTSVFVLNKQDIKDQSLISSDISNILGFSVPGFAFGNNQVGNRGQTLRGRDVLVMIDGIPQSSPLRKSDRNIRTIDPSVIERIEVVKGATSIYGNGAGGGIVNYITKAPDKNNDRYISGKTVFGFTSHNFLNDKMFRSEGGAGPRVSQSFYGRIKKIDYIVSGTYTRTGVRIDGEDQIQNPRYGLGESNIYNVFAKVGYNIDDKSRMELMYNYFSSLQNSKYILKKGKYGQIPSTGILGKRRGVEEGTKYNHNAYLSYRNKEIFRNTSLASTLYFRDFYTIYDYRGPKRWVTGGQAGISDKKYGLRTDFNTVFRKNDKAYLYLTYGLDLLKENTIQPLVDGRIWVPDLELNSLAPFVQGRFLLSPELTLNTGLRWDLINVKVPDYTTLPSGDEIAYDIKGGTLRYKNLSYNLGVNYGFTENFQFYTSYSRGFSIYDLGRTLRAAKTNVLENIETDPVVVDSYVVGVNTQVLKTVNLSASYFYNYAPLGTELQSVNGFWVVDRAPQYVQGVEVIAEANPIKSVHLGVSYVYQEGKKIGKNDERTYLNGTSIAAPRLNSYIRYGKSRYELGLYHLYSFKRDRFSPNAKTGLYKEGEGPVSAFGIVNLQGRYKINRSMNVGLGIENLFNKTYFTPTAMFTARDNEYVRANGRYYTVSVSYKY
ncbi:MAG: TonB-dependent receptor [Bergeyella sp.]|nr:TonB-dependent receptor [Bergeyella sp.]